MKTEMEQKFDRLTQISINKPLNPQTFIPWSDNENGKEWFLPQKLISLHGHPLYNQLSFNQKRELSRLEVSQVMYSYGWSEGLACAFFNKRLLKLKTDSSEYRFLIRELIEEYQHQQMFSDAIRKIKGEIIKPSFSHRFFSNLTLRIFPDAWMFMSVLSIELVTDVYGKHMRKDKDTFSVLRKISELHNIEEGRHIHFTKLWLDKYTHNASWIKRSWYSMIVLLNIYFMRTMYVRQEFFSKIGVNQPEMYTKAAKKQLKKNFAEHCLKDIMSFVKEWNGFNLITRPIWRITLNASI